MADLLTPSSVTMTTINAAADKPEKSEKADVAQKSKPEKPDEQQYKEKLAKAEKEHAAAQQKVNAIKARIDDAQPLNKDSPAGRRQQHLRSELQSIRQQQSTFKASRGNIHEKIAALDTQFKSRAAEQKAARGRIAFKNVEEVDQEIARLLKQVDAGTMKLVDEKKALAEVSSLRKQRKGFAGFEEAQRSIDDLKTQINELRKSLDNPEAKALSQKYDEISEELNTIKAEQDKAYSSLSALRDERTRLNTDQQEKYAAMKAIKDQYFKARMAYRDFEQDQYRIRQERVKSERDAYQKEKRRKFADQKLEEASEPAFTDEILTAEGLIRYFEPSSVEATKSLRGPSGFAAEAQRSVEGSDFKGIKVSRKEEREDNYFTGTGGKKGKKGKKGSNAASPAPSTPTEGKFNISMGIIEELAKVNVEPPINQAGVPAVVEQLKQKREQWKKDQDSKTRENIERAQKEIDRLENEAIETQNSIPPSSNKRTQDSTKKQAVKSQLANGTNSAGTEPKQNKEAETDLAQVLEKATIDDKAEE